MPFNINSPFNILRRDFEGKIRSIHHVAEPYKLDVDEEDQSIENIAKKYLEQILDNFQISDSVLNDLNTVPEIDFERNFIELRRKQTKDLQTLLIVFYAQTYFGIPIYGSGMSLKIRPNPLEVIGIISTWNYDSVNVPVPSDTTISRFINITAAELAQLLNIDEPSNITINKSESIYLYQYKAAQQLDNTLKDGFFSNDQNPISIPEVDSSIEENGFYLIREILFSFPSEVSGLLNWRCFIELNTGSVLNITVFSSSVTGMVFLYDPITLGANVNVDDADTVLDPLRQSVTLIRLENPGAGNQELRGDTPPIGYAFIIDPIDHPTDPLHNPPAEDPPNEPTPYNFNYNSRTANFAAVIAYFNVDRFIALIADLGINLLDQFPNTVLPLHVDHRAFNNAVGASAPGNAAGNASIGIRLGAISTQAPFLGMATDYRVILHEFGHVLLYDHIEDPNLNFSHSYGDSLAAIINDTVSLAPDRFDTFPWATSINTALKRRHDRDVFAGWAWHGQFDYGGYDSEQILSTTMFRIYRSLGGDSVWAVRKEYAARIVVLLLLKATRYLTVATNPATPEDFATELMIADTDLSFLPNVLDTFGLGASHKVVRWGFEKQGAYQLGSGDQPGLPPDVDVYIDDGRAGEYQYLDVFWDTQDIINRRNPDGIFTHQTPLLNTTNYVYVKINHRGTVQANNVFVEGFHCSPGGGNIWPQDWSPMLTPQITVGGVTPGQQLTIGPFSWIPTVQGHECLLMVVNADGDLANTQTIVNVPDWYFVPNDNNVAQRNVAPAPVFHGGTHLEEAFNIYQFCVRNPYHAEVRVSLVVELPPILADRGWELIFTTPGQEFTLKSFDRSCTLVKMRMIPGADFTRDDVINVDERDIVVKITTEKGIIGGMTYSLDPDLERYNETE